jgi:hypothetical protein
VRNIVERLLLSLANRSNDATILRHDPIFAYPVNWRNYCADIKYKFPTTSPGVLDSHITEIDTAIAAFTLRLHKIQPTWQLTETSFFVSGATGEETYRRDIAPARMRLLIERAGEPATARMLMRYAAILPGPSHWEAPPEYFDTLYALGCRFEGFSSPVNSGMMRFDDAHICTLFPDVDAPWGSIGSFFQVDFLKMADEPIVVVGPPYYDELILAIAQHVIDHCDRAKAANRKIRFIITHSNSWDYSEGFRLLKESPYKSLDHVFARNAHYYQNDLGERIVARFETRLFVLESGFKPLSKKERHMLTHLFTAP